MSIDEPPSFLGKGKKNLQPATQGNQYRSSPAERGRDEALARAAGHLAPAPRGRSLESRRRRIERVSTQTLFDVLEVPQRSRGAGPAGA